MNGYKRIQLPYALVALTASLVLAAGACDKKASEGDDKKAAAASPGTEGKPEPKKAPKIKALSGPLTGAWLKANKPAINVDPADLPKWNEAKKVLEKQYGPATHTEKPKDWKEVVYWAAMDGNDCVYVSVDVQQGDMVLDVTHDTAKNGGFSWSTCLKAAKVNPDDIGKNAAGNGKTVTVDALLSGIASKPTDWVGAKLMVTGTLGQSGSSTSNGVTQHYVTIASKTDAKQRITCYLPKDQAPADDLSGDVKAQGKVQHRTGSVNAKPELIECTLQK